eukprot:819601-Pyramimonas_sp.AAC.1
MLLFVIPQLTTHGLAQAEPTDFWQVPESSTLQLAPGLDDERTLTNFKYAMYLKLPIGVGTSYCFCNASISGPGWAAGRASQSERERHLRLRLHAAEHT